MNVDELQTIWNSSLNKIPEGEQQKILTRFSDGLRAQRRRHRYWIVWSLLQLTLITGFTLWLLLGTTRVNLGGEWALVPLLILPWFTLLALKKSNDRDKTPFADETTSVRDALGAASRANAAAIVRSRILGCMYLASAPILALAGQQLQVAGKASPRESLCMMLFLGACLTAAALAVGMRYRFRLIPQRKHLAGVMRQFLDPDERVAHQDR